MLNESIPHSCLTDEWIFGGIVKQTFIMALINLVLLKSPIWMLLCQLVIHKASNVEHQNGLQQKSACVINQTR